MSDKLTIKKEYAHKLLNENVMVAYTRRQLPRVISKDIFESDVISKMTSDEATFLYNYYHLCNKNGAIPCYVLRSAGFKVRKEIRRVVEIRSSESENANFIRQFVQSDAFCDSKNALSVFNDTCSEFYEELILEKLGKKNLRINHNERRKIYNLLLKTGYTGWPENAYYAQMHVNIKHPFFFEHPNEHLPGLMLIEAIRQFGIACSHLYLEVPLRSIHFILSDFYIQYKGYLELNLPIMFEGKMNKASFNKKGMITYADYSTKVFQNNREMAHSQLIGKYLNSNLFKILRKAKQAELSSNSNSI